jgi:hypothetical protein
MNARAMFVRRGATPLKDERRSTPPRGIHPDPRRMPMPIRRK